MQIPDRTVPFNFPEKPAAAIRKCQHGVYFPNDQTFAHGCQFCNPAANIFEEFPGKTIAIFRLQAGTALRDIRLHAYGTVFEFKKVGGYPKKYRHGSPIEHE